MSRTAGKNKVPQKGRAKLALLLAALVLLLAALAAGIAGIYLADRPRLDPASAQMGLSASGENAEPYGGFVTPELQQAYGVNPDVVGWLSLPGCDIDDPVVQGEDNDQYLRRTIESEEYDVWGCYFLDYINYVSAEELFDRVSIIYGHALDDLADSEKFSRLKFYKDQEFLDQHPTFTFALTGRELTFEIFAVSDMPITIDYIDPNPDDEKFQDTFGYMLEHSYVDCGVELLPEDRVLLLSTCTSDDQVRFVVAARLVSDTAAN